MLSSNILSIFAFSNSWVSKQEPQDEKHTGYVNGLRNLDLCSADLMRRRQLSHICSILESVSKIVFSMNRICRLCQFLDSSHVKDIWCILFHIGVLLRMVGLVGESFVVNGFEGIVDDGGFYFRRRRSRFVFLRGSYRGVEMWNARLGGKFVVPRAASAVKSRNDYEWYNINRSLYAVVVFYTWDAVCGVMMVCLVTLIWLVLNSSWRVWHIVPSFRGSSKEQRSLR